jgi:ABC-type glycerol-3-phosphate transport system substrate-binding protein
MEKRMLNRRDFLRLSAVAATGAAIAACAPAAPEVVEVEKPVVVEKEVVKEVPVEKVVEKEVQVVVTATPAVKPGEKPVIRWQHDGGGRWSTAAQQGAATFNEMQDEIVLLIEPRPPNAFEKIMAAMVAGVAPDVFEWWGLWFAKLHQKGQLRDVQPLVDESMTAEEIADFVPNEWDNFGRLSFIPGKRVAMPRYINFMYLEYNKDFFDEGGVDYPDINWTMDDMKEAAEKLTVMEGGEITRFGGSFRSAHSMERQFYHLNRFGGNFVKYEEPKKCLLGTPEAQEAMEWLRARYFDDEIYLPRVLADQLGGRPIVGGFVAMVEDGGPHYVIRDGLDTYALDYTHPCQGPVRRSSYLVTDGYGLWLGSRSQDAAWEVMRYLAGPINQDIRQAVTGQTATLMSVVAKWPEQVVELDAKMADTNLHIPLEAFEMGYGKDDERFFCQAEAEEILNPLLQKVYMIGDSPVSILADACPEVEAAQTCEAI